MNQTILIEKSNKQFKNILWVGNNHNELEKKLPERLKNINYDVIENIEWTEGSRSPVYDSTNKTIIEFSETPDGINQQDEIKKEKLIEDEIYKNARVAAITSLQNNNKLDENEKLIKS